VIGSYGWSTKAAEQIAALLPILKPEILPPVICRGRPRAENLAQVDTLAEAITARHARL
jgi:flavorubredoxin